MNHIVMSEELLISMIDVYARSNNLEKAEHYARLVKKNKTLAWTAFLAGCKKVVDYSTVRRIRKEFPFLEKDASAMVLMSNVAAVAGEYGEKDKMREMMDERNLKKIPGVSYVVLQNGQVHRYTVEDEKVPKKAIDMIDSIYFKIAENYNYVADVSCVLRKFPDREVAITHLHRHSEKLALGMALTEPGNHTIDITENLRMCMDCHNFIEKTSNLYPSRKIIIEDTARSHIFMNGSCSCGGDY
ncbi:pentatricopeptide repeat-containing protein [Acrasis kona]|uniref:Pentatricopeptide repeat-containing protein n=1 Tax=Acrasis kona TaxID=1008807 RepID=A0AAW2ZEL9_9EUKA